MKVIVSLSGGLDSTTVLALLLEEGHEVYPVLFQYGSKHNVWEQKAAKAVCFRYQLLPHVIDLTSTFSSFKSNLLKTGGAIPEGHYNDDSMSQTVVPGRNIIFLSVLAGLAWSEEARGIGIGIHQGDHAIYADCRLEFFKAMDVALYLGTDRRVQLLAPFKETDKVGIVKWGLKHDVPYHLTRTCYKDQEYPCGKCGSCRERLEAFELNNMDDPVDYELEGGTNDE